MNLSLKTHHHDLQTVYNPSTFWTHHLQLLPSQTAPQPPWPPYYFLNNPSVLPLKAFAVQILSDFQILPTQDYRVCAPPLHLCLSVFAEWISLTTYHPPPPEQYLPPAALSNPLPTFGLCCSRRTSHPRTCDVFLNLLVLSIPCTTRI